jgi:hypothetical protein
MCRAVDAQHDGGFMSSARRTRRPWSTALGLITAIIFILGMAGPTFAAPPGNNGTVKIHDGAGETEPIIQNEPHVGCGFHLHFFFSDPGQAGTWWIQSWPPTGNMTTVLSGDYLSGPNGEVRMPQVGVYTLTSGHYKLFWVGRNDNNIKHKVFWTDCDPTQGPCTTWFFSSAAVGTEFFQGDTWQGGTFTFIESGNHMLVRLETDTAIVGRFPMGFINGDMATITFNQPIHIQKILWHDNDPKLGEAGWSFNGIAGPLTGNQNSVVTDVNLTTSVVNIDAGGDSGGIDFCF